LFPADSGGKIRSVNILRGMRGGAFDITLASPLPDAPSAEDAARISDVCDRFTGWPAAKRGNGFRWTRMRHLASALPVSVATDYSASGASTVGRELARGPDVVVVDFPHTSVLAPPPYPCPSVLFTHNVEAEIFRRHAQAAGDPIRRAVWRNQADKMARLEGQLLPKFSAVVAVAARDREYFQRNYGAANVSVIPTGVDLDYFNYVETPSLDSSDAGTLVFTGSMDWMANIDAIEFFMDQVWPRVARARPNARFVVVGRTPPPGLMERARARGLNWTFTGFVDDVRPYVHQAHVYVIPLRVGGGTRIKVYEAMAMGCPVVSTRIGVEGLPLERERHFLEADQADEMAQAILSLLANTERRVTLSRQARSYVDENMSAGRAARVFERICQSVLTREERRQNGTLRTDAILSL
jgi:glycosyltransferase involved in cell wall biosynthesis